jgi:quercetin dioxygenase-like cupin family protein
MADVTVKTIDDFEASFGGGFVHVRDGLGVSSFGLQVLRFPPNADQHPEHDHAHDGQEEVYCVIDGSLTLRADGEEHELSKGSFARVGPGVTRQLYSGDEPATVIALGGVPGKAYEVPG